MRPVRAMKPTSVVPVYVGEVVLGLGVLAILFSVRTSWGGPIRLLMLAFMARRAPDDPLHRPVRGGRVPRRRDLGLRALRAVREPDDHRPPVPDLLGFYRRVIPFYLVWVPITLILSRVLPGYPGGLDWLIAPKPGDMGVLLAGIAAFALLGLYSAEPKPRVPEWLMWPLGCRRGGRRDLQPGRMVAMVTAAAVLLFLRLPRRWLRGLLQPADRRRAHLGRSASRHRPGPWTISVGQIADNVTSVITDTNDPALEGTKEFRLRWWSHIIDYTIRALLLDRQGVRDQPRGRGRFPGLADDSLRAPHNGHLEILARMGVPGLSSGSSSRRRIAIGLLRAAAERATG